MTLKYIDSGVSIGCFLKLKCQNVEIFIMVKIGDGTAHQVPAYSNICKTASSK